MKTREPPLSSKTPVSSKGDKAEESESSTRTPLGRFREAGAKAFQVPVEEVRKEERREKRRKKP